MKDPHCIDEDSSRLDRRNWNQRTRKDPGDGTPRSSRLHSWGGECIVAVGPRWHSPQPPSQREEGRAHDHDHDLFG
jgi:hypothetical protein